MDSPCSCDHFEMCVNSVGLFVQKFEHFKIIIFVEANIVTLGRTFWLRIQDISTYEVLVCQKSNRKSNLPFPPFFAFSRLLAFSSELDF